MDVPGRAAPGGGGAFCPSYTPCTEKTPAARQRWPPPAPPPPAAPPGLLPGRLWVERGGGRSGAGNGSAPGAAFAPGPGTAVLTYRERRRRNPAAIAPLRVPAAGRADSSPPRCPEIAECQPRPAARCSALHRLFSGRRSARTPTGAGGAVPPWTEGALGHCAPLKSDRAAWEANSKNPLLLYISIVAQGVC